ncbi:glycosyl hydrolase [uncultured Dysgonomonas sp.]|uniref:Glycoside hydrolase family 2 sugar binding n=1 Tax=uncultured Dysgonomonas sp. TaxID=206096 RepID=A0A212K5C2_9BACT|nr:glycosyl hydrolase [uncultured Dysgonomonas sp.]SBW06818.1 Glycoside hydrolase family 2 sugar binding [uncultured Dysgonomonas sp.]
MKKTIQLFLITVISLFLSCKGNDNAEPSLAEIRDAFREVPQNTQIAVYWYWISDNISEEGVIKDLEAMKKAGINRAFIGNIGLDDITYGEHKLFSEGWWKIMHTALKKASELNIEIGIFNSPGWSQSGGPWVKPEESMRYLASSELVVEGPVELNDKLPEVGERAQDVRVIAYPLPDTEESKKWQAAKKHGASLNLDMHMSGKHPVRSLIIQVDRPILTPASLYCKENGEYKLLKDFTIDRSNMQMNVGFDPLAPIVISLPEIKATDYRLVLPEDGNVGFEATLSSLPMVERYPEKTLAKMFQTPLPLWHDYLWEKQPMVTEESILVDPSRVVDITSNFNDGKLKWNVPEGKWKILRTAMRSTTTTNGPASPEGLGLEIDKMSKTHVATHFDAFIGEILRRIPAEDRTSFKVVVQDSYETGGQNWTDDMAERFLEVYGYDPIPFLPVLRGTVVGSPDLSDRFLWDLRRLIADRVSYDYVGGLRDESHKHGLVTWLENYGHWGFPGEFLQYGGQSDEVAGEYWSEGSLGDIENRAASSCAHIYGKRNVWAESFTAAGAGFSRYPYLMKQRGDRFFTEGINSTLLHVYIQQPYEDRNPGMSAWFGNEFNRKNTWFEHIDLFTNYLKRTNFMLQQGQYIADVAYFIGEDAPKMTGICDPALPSGYSFDYINGEVLMTRSTVRDGKLILESGMEYKVLVLPKLNTMRPELLVKIEEMVRQGLVILGPAPESSPSMKDYPEADKKVKELATGLWADLISGSHRQYGKGYVFNDGNSLENVFSTLSVTPDFSVSGDGKQILFIHRKLKDADIYFVSNQREQKVSFDATFRATNSSPELWDALTGETRLLPEYSVDGATTTMPLELEAYGSAFIIFNRENSEKSVSGKNFPPEKIITTIETPWEVTFNGIVAPESSVIFEKLYDWKESSDPQIKYFSGTARYKTTIDMKSIPDNQLYIDLGKVMVMGKVFINGNYAGGVWTYPYRVNISKWIKEGENTIEVEVSNNWINRLIGDQQLPTEQRKTWTPVNPWNSSSELQSSGLLGPVTVQSFDYFMDSSKE